jgi:hypothetical protein
MPAFVIRTGMRRDIAPLRAGIYPLLARNNDLRLHHRWIAHAVSAGYWLT